LTVSTHSSVQASSCRSQQLPFQMQANAPTASPFTGARTPETIPPEIKKRPTAR
jgi:hypothetical protein